MSNYSFDDIVQSEREYLEIYKFFLELAQDKYTYQMLISIFENGVIPIQHVSIKNNPSIEAWRRISYAYLLLRNPKTFDYFLKNNISFFHGTNSRSLSSILKYGLTSYTYSNNNNIEMSTGETPGIEKAIEVEGHDASFLRKKRKDFISFTNVFDIAEWYSSSRKTENDFGMVIATSEEEILKNPYDSQFYSDYPEVGVVDKLPIECIKVICVPSSKVNLVEKMIGNFPITVLPLDDMPNKFFSCFKGDELEVYPNNFNEFKKNYLAQNRTAKKNYLKKIQEWIHGMNSSDKGKKK